MVPWQYSPSMVLPHSPRLTRSAERFVGPAAEAAERGLGVDALVEAMRAALAFDDGEDPQSVDLQRMLREQDAATFTATVTGLEPEHPLFPRVVAAVADRQAEIAV